MSVFSRPRAICVGVCFSFAIACVLLWGGDAISQDQASSAATSKIDRLEYELGVLRRKQNLLGKNHPQREEVDQRIAELIDKLEGEKLGGAPGDSTGSSPSLDGRARTGGVIPLTNAEMVAVLKSMSDRIERLEARVRRLEQAQ